jgi:predicted O-methyltransferase YrrM
MNRFTSIIHFLLNAKKRHGVHSPYIFSLTDDGLRTKVSKINQNNLNKYRNFLRSNSEKIEIEDFGAGSKKHGTIRSVQQIFNISSSKTKYGKLLYRLAHHFEVKNVLELGTNLGWGTYNLHLGAPEAKIVSIEGCKSIFEFNKKHFPTTENTTFVHATFDDYITRLTDEKFDLIFIDGDHRGASLLKYISALKKHSHNETIWIFDDIRWSDDMWQTWSQLILQQEFHVSIDMFRLGIVVQRKQQMKEHFIIRP